MARVYEALRRAEEERKRKAGGEATSVTAVDWDPSPQLPLSVQASDGFLARQERAVSWFDRQTRSRRH